MPTKRLCSIDGCGKPHCAHGFCMGHYRRWQRHGDPLGGGAPTGRAAPSQICSFPDCDKPAHGRVWCRGHYSKWWRYGDPAVTLKPTQNSLLPWLHAHVAHKGDRCLQWPYGRNKETGYGKMLFRGKDMSASRAMCILAYGEPPTPKHQSAHSCGKAHEGCVNPKHLRWALPFENQQDKMKHGTGRHLTTAQKEEIRKLAKTMTVSAIARRYGFAQSSISHFLSGKRRPKYT